jgi:hypothetical protein
VVCAHLGSVLFSGGVRTGPTPWSSEMFILVSGAHSYSGTLRLSWSSLDRDFGFVF